MAQLNFDKVNNFWEATIRVETDFNLHIERAETSMLSVDVKTVEDGDFFTAFADTLPNVVDQDYDGLVYPKYIRVRTWSKPNANCIITVAGV